MFIGVPQVCALGLWSCLLPTREPAQRYLPALLWENQCLERGTHLLQVCGEGAGRAAGLPHAGQKRAVTVLESWQCEKGRGREVAYRHLQGGHLPGKVYFWTLLSGN